MKRVIVLMLIICLMVPVSCAKAPAEEESMSVPGYVTGQLTEREEPVPPAPEITLKIPPAMDGALVSGDIGQEWATERMIVRTGDVWLVVNNVPVVIEQITGMADGFDGYVVSSRVWKEGESLVGSIAVRVPAEHFDDAMRALRGMAVEITSESTTSKDVTEEYVDLSAELKNLEATEEQYLRLMELVLNSLLIRGGGLRKARISGLLSTRLRAVFLPIAMSGTLAMEISARMRLRPTHIGLMAAIPSPSR